MPAPAFDLTDLDTYQGGFPHEIFTWLRANAPLYRHEPTAHTPQGEAFWVVSRHADALAIQLDPKRFSSVTGGSRERGGTMISDQFGAGLMLNMMDDPRHRRIRGLVNKGFTPHRIGALEPELRRRARAILDAVPADGACDFVTDVARELPLQAICLLLGVPQEDRAHAVRVDGPRPRGGVRRGAEPRVRAHALGLRRRADPREARSSRATTCSRW